MRIVASRRVKSVQRCGLIGRHAETGPGLRKGRRSPWLVKVTKRAADCSSSASTRLPESRPPPCRSEHLHVGLSHRYRHWKGRVQPTDPLSCTICNQTGRRSSSSPQGTQMHGKRKVLRPLAAVLIATAIAVPALAQQQGLSATGPGTAAAARVTTATATVTNIDLTTRQVTLRRPDGSTFARHRGRTGAQPAAAARWRHCDARVLRHASARAQEGRHRCAVEPHRQLQRIAGCARPAARWHHGSRDRDRCRRHRCRRAEPDHFSAWPGRPGRYSAT